MRELVETKLQKFILLIGGVAIFAILTRVDFYTRWQSVLQSVGIAVIVFVLLVIFREYQPGKFAIFSFFVVVVMIGLYFGVIAYNKAKEEKIKRQAEETFHNGEVAYQQCLTRVFKETRSVTEPNNPPKTFCPSANEDSWICAKTRTHNVNIFSDEWRNAGNPYRKSTGAYWEISFMKWFMENHRDFCGEYGIDSIEYFLKIKTKIVEIN